MKSILDKGFRYVPSYETDIRTTLERARKQQEANKREAEQKVAGVIKPTVRAKVA